MFRVSRFTIKAQVYSHGQRKVLTAKRAGGRSFRTEDAPILFGDDIFFISVKAFVYAGR